jgi:hypothetical protein
MASGKPTPDPAALHATRQMLDELDALMERMLQLPINEPAEPIPAPHPGPAPPSRNEPLGDTTGSRPLVPTLSLLQVQREEMQPAGGTRPGSAKQAGLGIRPTQGPAPDPAHQAANPSHLPILGVVGYASANDVARGAAALPELPGPPAEPPQPFSDRIVPPLSQPSVDSLLAEVPEPEEPFASWFILPLVWGNRLFDRGTLMLGDSGSWLRTPMGRSALGMIGLVLLTAALLWLARDWFGWTW